MLADGGGMYASGERRVGWIMTGGSGWEVGSNPTGPAEAIVLLLVP